MVQFRMTKGMKYYLCMKQQTKRSAGPLMSTPPIINIITITNTKSLLQGHESIPVTAN